MQGMDAATGKALGGIDHLKQSIRDILRTRIGTRVMRRSYGADLPNLIDAPTNEALAVDLYAAIAEALDDEPRLRVTRIRIISADQNGRLGLALEAEYLPDGKVVTVDGVIVE
jgi:phage baseplate assembly protein W